MKISRELLRFSPLLLVLALGNGCVTKALWENGNLEAWKEPATNPNPRFYEGRRQKDLLVVYDEYSERRDATRTRAYWLNENQERILQRRRPDFVSTNAALRMPALPVFDQLPKVTNRPPLYVLLGSDRQSFTVYSATEPLVSCGLPVYNDGKGKIEKAALTPPAVTADLTIVGGFLGYFWLEGFAQSGGSISFH